MNRSPTLTHVAIRLPKPAIKRADAIAAATQSTRSQVLRHALSIGLMALVPIYEAKHEVKTDAA